MARIQVHARLTCDDNGMAQVRRNIGEIVDAARRPGSGMSRCDWFVNDERREYVAMIVHADADSMQAHHTACSDAYNDLLSHARGALDIFDATDIVGALDATEFAGLAGYQLRQFEYADGLGARGARPIADLTIEIVTVFAVLPGQLALFKQQARELTDIVRDRDTGTARYDWYYNDRDNICIALDTYVDAAAMFAHMKNCHDAHEKLLKISTMTTDFLGELPAVAMQVVAKYNPYILRFVGGLQSG
jgi:quinol monooxygenase YgiN